MVNPISLESVSAAFNDWRKHRASTRERIPLALQRQAIELLLCYSKSRVIKALNINHAMLKRWQLQNAPTSDGEFIRLSTTSLPASTPTSLRVTLRNADGGELTVTGITLSQLSTLATHFTASAGESL